MLYSYMDCERKYGNHYQVAKVVKKGSLYKIEDGVYSDERNVSEMAVIAFK